MENNLHFQSASIKFRLTVLISTELPFIWIILAVDLSAPEMEEIERKRKSIWVIETLENPICVQTDDQHKSWTI